MAAQGAFLTCTIHLALSLDALLQIVHESSIAYLAATKAGHLKLSSLAFQATSSVNTH
jgi:hypothetical protein